MSKRVQYHIVRDGGEWKVKKSGAERASSVHGNKNDAIESARELAQKRDLGQVIVHGRDGVIQTEWTYKKDPRKYPG